MLMALPRLFIPVEESYMQHIYVIDKDEKGNVTRKKEYGGKCIVSILERPLFKTSC